MELAKKKKLLAYGLSIGFLFINTGNTTINFIIYSMSMIPLAFMLGELTSSISTYIGEKKGGLLTATVGNLPELLMNFWSIKLGLMAMVKASIIGSIVNNMLLVLGVSIFVGGLKYKEQKFNKNIAKTNFKMLLLVISSMVIMQCINAYGNITDRVLINISVAISVILIIIYILGLVFSIYTHGNLFTENDNKDDSVKLICKEFLYLIGELIFITVLINFTSEIVIRHAAIVMNEFSISETFMGIILIPLLGNIGENISAIICAYKNKVNISLEIAIGSSLQMGLFAVPMLVLVSFIIGAPLILIFNIIHIIIAGIAIMAAFIVFGDGKTYWFEGTILIAIYIIITICYFFVV